MPIAAASMHPDASARDSSSDLSLANLIDQLTERISRGENIDLSDFLTQHPHHADRLRPLLPMLQALAALDSSVGNALRGVPLADSLHDVPFAAGEDSPAASNPQSEICNLQLSDFRLLRQIGRGGMGIVYEAEQISLQRRVALKILPLAGLLDDRLLQRFKNEAQAAASLNHPNIVPIYSVGCEHGLHYYAMQLIEGRSLAEVIAASRSRLPDGTLHTDSRSRLPDGTLHTNPKRERGNREQETRDRRQPTEGNRDNRAEKPAEGNKDNKERQPNNSSFPSLPFQTASSPFPQLPPVQSASAAATNPQSAIGRPTPGGHPQSRNPLLPLLPSVQPASPPFPPLSPVQIPSGVQRFRWVAELGIQAAEALQYAHDRGIIHRDIKPANLLLENPPPISHHSPLTNHHSPRLWITDFGLAHIDGADNLTMSGDLLGTLRYMSPEQALGSSTTIDHRTDIYSLGATLYELLTGQAVIHGNSRSQLLRQITHDNPRPPRTIDSRIPLDLQTIVLKALSKEPSDRYPAARELAADLERFHEGKPISARPLTPWQKLIHWSRRHTALVLTAAASLAGALILVSIAAGFALRAEGHASAALSQASTNLSVATQREQEMQLALYAADIPAIQRAWQTGDLNHMRSLLERHIPATADQTDHRGFEWHYFWRLCHKTPIIVQAHQRPICALAISNDEQLLATGDDHGHVKLWQIPGFEPLGELTHHPDGIRALSFVNEDHELISVGAEGEIRRWDTESHQRLSAQFDQPCPITGAALSRDGALLAIGGADRRVRVWHLASQQLACTSSELPAKLSKLTFGPNLKIVYTADQDGRIHAIDTASGEHLNQALQKGEISDLFVAYQGDTSPALISCRVNGFARNHDLPNLYHRGYEGMHNGRLLAGAAVPGQLAFVTGGDDGCLKLWELSGGGRAMLIRRVHPYFGTPVCSIDISRHGQWLVAGGADGRLIVTDIVLAGEQLRVLNAKMVERPSGNSLSADGRLWVSTGTEGVVQLWDTTSGKVLSHLPLSLPKGPYWTALSSDDRQLAIGHAPGGVEFWGISDATQPRLLSTPTPLKDALHAGTFFPNDRRLALCFKTFVGLWETANEQLLAKFQINEPVQVAVSPNGDYLVAGNLNGDICAWDVAKQRCVGRSIGHGHRTACLKVSPDGRLLAVGDGAGICLYDFPELTVKAQLRSPAWTTSTLAFSPDGRTLASGSQTLEVHLWNLPTFNEVARFHLMGHIPQAVCFAPDGKSLTFIGYPGQISTFSVQPQP